MIKKVEAFVLSHRLGESFFFSQHSYDSRTICLVKLTMADGLSGWGEGYGPAGLVRAGIEFFTPLILDKDPMEQETLWQSMYLRSLDHARGGVLLSALSAIDIALWDLKGKILRQPISSLLGGRKNDSIPAYATGLYFRDCEELSAHLAAEAKTYREQGFSAVKMKVGLGLERDLENIRAVRQAVGSDIALMIDANHAYSFREALQLSKRIEEFDIAWFEEPLSPEDYEGYRELRKRSSTPIAAGECERLRHGFLRLFSGRCVDIAQPDPCAAGGITETKKISDLASAFGVDFVPHCWGSCIAVATSLHLLSNWDSCPGRLFPKKPILELDRTENPFRETLGSPSFVLDQGELQVPDTPGLGIEIDEAIIQRYAVDRFTSEET